MCIRDSFTGFTPETIDFLWELRMNNNKAWMEENRERYRTVLKEPFDALSAALTKKFLEKKNVPQMDFSISRINRDVRFSKDKSPYKARKWMVLKLSLIHIFHSQFPKKIYGFGGKTRKVCHNTTSFRLLSYRKTGKNKRQKNTESVP